METSEILERSGLLQEEILTSTFQEQELPLPFCEDLQYYDGNVFFMWVIAEEMRAARLNETQITLKQMVLVASTNGMNDWWLDEYGWTEQGRNYPQIIQLWNGINAWAYHRLYPNSFPEVNMDSNSLALVIRYYDRAVDMLPADMQSVIVQNLLAINLYQGLTLLQESGARALLGFPALQEEDRELLERMQIEKGGVMSLYFALLQPSQFDLSSVLPERPPTLAENYQRFMQGEAVYPTEGHIRYAIELGGVIQLLDDLEDVNFDLFRGVISPENLRRRLHDTSELSELIISRTEEALALLVHRKYDSPLHTALYTAAVRLIRPVAQYRAHRVLVRNRDFVYA